MTKKETTHCSDEQCREEHCTSEQDSPPSHSCKGACVEEQIDACIGTCEEQKQDTELQELTQTLQLLQADFENYRKRVERDNADFKRYATKQLITDLLPVLDNFDHALKTIDDEGVRLIHMQVKSVLEKYGLQEIDCTDKKFDPKMHQALAQVESEKEPNTILEVLQKGYIVGDVVLRPARVTIARKKDETAGVSTRGNAQA